MDNRFQSMSVTFEVPSAVCNALVIIEQLGGLVDLTVEEDGLITLSALLYEPAMDGETNGEEDSDKEICSSMCELFQ